uniref:Small acidic protein-like domain-containing protein n=1 Tax=Nomascus leucogenys TaxID=61853 RepID=A0A2I3H2S1_NOMLE
MEITKTHKVDLGPGIPEKKKKKKVVKEPETQYSILNNDDYFAHVSPMKATVPSKSVVHGQVPEMPLVKKKKEEKGVSTLCEEHIEPETTLRRLGHLEFLSGEKKKRKSPLAMSHTSGVKISPDPRHGEEETRVGKKLKKHKKEKREAQDPTAFSVQDPWFCEVGDAVDTCSVGKEGEEQVALGQKRKHKGRRRRKKKIHQEGDALPGHSKPSSKKKPVKVEAPEYIPIGDGPKTPVKQPVIEEPALKRKKKKRKESGVAGDPWKEETDTDLEVVLEKKGNMDQMRRKALQEETERESGKTETGTQFGQWDTAGFGNEEQKLKFLKLMGGFKNFPHPHPPAPPSPIARSIVALSKKVADSLQQSLQREYDLYSRGAGLGFSTARNQIFYIDRNASKSVKLED